VIYFRPVLFSALSKTHERGHIPEAPAVRVAADRDPEGLPPRVAGQGCDRRTFSLHRLDSVGHRLCRTGPSAGDYRPLRGIGGGHWLRLVFQFAARHCRTGCRHRAAGRFSHPAAFRRRSGTHCHAGGRTQPALGRRADTRGAPETGGHRRPVVTPGADRLSEWRVAGPDCNSTGQDVRHEDRGRGIFRNRIHLDQGVARDSPGDFRFWRHPGRHAGCVWALDAAPTWRAGSQRSGNCRLLRA